MDHGYPNGLTKKDIPYEGQIIRVADEYDAIVSKRQYKTHIGVSDTIKIIIENSEPRNKVEEKSFIKKLVKKPQYGKNNKVIVKALIKVVIDDIEYELSCTFKYLHYLKDNIKRLEEAEKFYKKSLASKNETKRKYYEDGITACLIEDENLDNWQSIYSEYQSAYKSKHDIIKNLENEVKIIKKLKV